MVNKTTKSKGEPFNAIKKAWAPIINPPVTLEELAELRRIVCAIALSYRDGSEARERIEEALKSFLISHGLEVERRE